MKIQERHKDLIITVGRALGELNSEVVYVGGAVVSLYVDDLAAPEVRPTDDVDIILEITSVGQLETLRQQLIAKGFRQSADDNVTCRFRYDGIKVDAMATQQVGWAPANSWFEPGFKYLQTVIVDDITIRVLSLSYFLASKIEAFQSRGRDPRTSHDLEDITYVLDNRKEISKEVLTAPNGVHRFLSNAFNEMLSDTAVKEAMQANLEYGIQAERFEMIEEKLNPIIKN